MASGRTAATRRASSRAARAESRSRRARRQPRRGSSPPSQTGRPIAARGGAREQRVPRLLHHLEQQEIGAGFGEQSRRARDTPRSPRSRRDTPARRSRAASTRSSPRSRLHGRSRRALRAQRPTARVDGRELVAAARGLEHEPRRRERARRDDVGAGRDVVRVDRRAAARSASAAPARSRRAGSSGMPRRRSSEPVAPSSTSVPPRERTVCHPCCAMGL